MYDYYLDANASLYGLRKGAEPLHIMLNPLDSMITIVNNGMDIQRNLMVQGTVYDTEGKVLKQDQMFAEVFASSVKRMFPVKVGLLMADAKKGAYVGLKIFDVNQKLLSENFYWLPASNGNFEGIKDLKEVNLVIQSTPIKEGQIEVTLKNTQKTIAFFNRVALINKQSKERILPAFYSDNYVSLLPGEERKIRVDFSLNQKTDLAIEVYGWNVKSKIFNIEN